MKKLSRKQREIDVRNGLIHRSSLKNRHRSVRNNTSKSWLAVNRWINEKSKEGLSVTVEEDNRLVLNLPEKLNFSNDYELTSIYMTAVRKLAARRRFQPYQAYKLRLVNFDGLRSISTSAALVLTAELSKWDDSIRQRLSPQVSRWDPSILKNLSDLGFFDLFANRPTELEDLDKNVQTNLRLVRYIKGKCGDAKKARDLKKEITKVVGDVVNKWTFLRSGLDEAITNVSHHAYPDRHGFNSSDKTWYLTGSFNHDSKQLKIAFYDQGIGIPKSLPESEIWEKILGLLSSITKVERYRDEVLLRAAVQLDRTSTIQTDRGKGLQDLLEFIRHRGDGYLAIMSMKGLYKCTIRGGVEHTKSEHFRNPLCGTLIIWKVILS